MNKEKKTLSFQVKALGVSVNAQGQEVGKIEAYGAIYNNVDEGNDRILPGAFVRTAKNNKARAENRNKDYALPMLWNHDDKHFLPLGGWYELDPVDPKGLRCEGDVLLATQIGREYYELAKAKMVDTFSIIYDIPEGGAKYDKSGVRELSELRLFSIDPVVFAMNDATYLVGVKSIDGIEYKAACGSTSGPIGPRDESWDGSAAKSWIWSKALDDEGNVKPAVAKRYFMRCNGDPKLKGSYGYPFWTHDHISVGGVKAVAGALSGARNADAEGDTAGMKRKVERLYGRINSKYPDAPKLVPPWKDGDGKSGGDSWERKTFIEHYNEEKAESLLSDLQGVWFAAFCKAVVDAFKIGDEPEVDISEALDNFKLQFMKDFVPRAMDCDMSDYLATDDMDSPLRTYYGGYGYMSRRSRLSRKELLASDATTGGFYAGDSDGSPLTRGHVDKLHQAAEKAMQAISEHAEGVHNIADQVTALIGGPNWTDRDAEKALPLAKAGRAFSGANAQALSDHAESLHDLADTHKKTMTRHIKAVRTVADDLADILQGSEAAYGTDAGTPDEGRQEGKSNRSTSYLDTRATPSRSSTAQKDTVSDEEIATSLQMLQALRATT